MRRRIPGLRDNVVAAVLLGGLGDFGEVSEGNVTRLLLGVEGR